MKGGAHESEKQLLERARGGDRAAAESLLARYREHLKRFVATMCGDEAEDLAHDAMAQALTDLPRFEGRSTFSCWLHGIALNLCRHHIRDKKRHAKTAESGVIEGKAARRGVLSSLYRRELVDRLDQAIERLPVSLREAFALRFITSMEYEEIAAITGVSVGTARVRAHRARALLQDELGPLVDPE